MDDEILMALSYDPLPYGVSRSVSAGLTIRKYGRAALSPGLPPLIACVTLSDRVLLARS